MNDRLLKICLTIHKGVQDVHIGAEMQKGIMGKRRKDHGPAHSSYIWGKYKSFNNAPQLPL